MSVVEKIQNAAGSLTPTERRLIQSVIESPRSAALGTANDLARSAGVHEATASRLARKLGFTNYAAFRDALREEFIPSQETATRFERTLSDSSTDSIVGSLARQEADALARIEDYITPDQIALAAQTLMRAGRIFVYAHGNAETLAVLMIRRFRRFGCDVHRLSGDPRDLAEQALGFHSGDVVLAFVFRRAPKVYAPLIDTAHAAGAATIVVSGASGATLVPRPDQLLAAPRAGASDAFQTLTVPMTVCNAIVISAGLGAKDSSLKSLDRLGNLIQLFE